MSSYYAGTTCGILTAGVLLYFLKRKRDKEGIVVYDEHQPTACGHGFQYAHITLIVLLMFYADFEEQTECFVSPGIVPIAILLLSGLILSAYYLFCDAYWSLRGEKKERRVLILWLAMALLSFAQNLHQAMKGGFKVNGRYLVTSLPPLLLGILFAGILLLQCIEYVMNRQEEEQRGICA